MSRWPRSTRYRALSTGPRLGSIAPFPAHVHERVVGACPSRGDQAIALGVDIGGSVARIDPQRMGAMSEAHCAISWLAVSSAVRASISQASSASG